MSAPASRMPAAVSVVVPTYNRADCLPDTVASILAQTVPPAEVIIVDDGSRDHTADVCRGFPLPVRYLYQENRGCPAARNTGIRAARGEYVALLDADDVWEATKLEVQLALHAMHPEIGWSATNHLTTDSHNQPLPGTQGFARDLPAFEAAKMSPDAFFSAGMARSEFEAAGNRHTAFTGDPFELLFFGNFVLPSSVMLRRALVEKVGLFDESLRCAEETEYFHRFGAISSLGVVMTPLVRWRRGQANTLVSSGNIEQLVRNAMLSLDRAVGLRQPTPRAQELCAAGKERLLHQLAYAQLSKLDRRGARSTLRQAWAEGLRVTTSGLGIYGVSLLPAVALRSLHRLKRELRG